jgi:RND family efflux transporter MFP subunit
MSLPPLDPDMSKPCPSILLAAVLILAGCGAQPQAEAAKPLPAVEVGTVAAAVRDRSAVELLPGTVRAASAATLMARVPGVVGRIAANPGATVAAGTVLVELDARELAARRDQARAFAAQAAADLERAQLLFAREAMTKAELDATRARAAGSAAAAAESEIMAGYTAIVAPFAGVVVRKHAEVGDLLSPGRPVVELEDPASLRLEVEVPESLAAQVVVGTRLRVLVASAALDQEAPVVEVTPAADPVSRTVLVKLALPAGARGLRSGQFGRVALPLAGGPQLCVPAAAVVRRGQLDAVFVVAEGRAFLRLVRPGGTDGGFTAIRAGLRAGELVAVEGVERLADGQPVTLR